MFGTTKKAILKYIVMENNFDKDLCVTKSLEFKDQEFSFDYNNRPKFKILNTFLALLSSLSIYTLQKSKVRSKINKS